jgi:amino acid adenylation domain-containing protein
VITRTPPHPAGREPVPTEPAIREGGRPTPGDEERRRILVDWNRTAVEYPRQATVPELFDAQVRERPQAVAVSFAGGQLTYAELGRRATRLARHLRGLGVGPEVPVAICVERSIELVVGLLGILGAGGAYVPLEPDDPPRRLDLVLEDTRAAVVLTQERLRERLPERAATVVSLDREWPGPAPRDGSGPLSRATADNLACVMYTSGSTGRPKGACIVHRAIMRLVRSADFVRFGPDQVFLQLAPLAFDASTLEIWGALLNGGRLVVAPPGRLDPFELAELIRREQVSALWLTAGLFHQVAEHSLDAFAGLRHLLAGGDVLSASHFNRVVSALPGVVTANCYGPTENTTFTCCHVATGPVEDGRVPIGRPIANTQVYVLDPELQPVPVGAWGELYAAGDGLARGYLRRPELTAERFLPNPFGEAGSRMYRSGDVVRYLPDGRIEFRGRVDDQIKIRGFRVEPGEVEAAIARHEHVREVVVRAREEPAGNRELVAYLVASASAGELLPALLAHLRDSLPPYMVPADFVLLDALPLTPNGKVDRRALETARQRATPPAAPEHGPRGEIEQRVADLWTETLEIDSPGRDDDFFELGGNSLLAMRVTTRIVEAFGVRVTPRRFYEDPTVAGLARAIAAQCDAPDGTGRGGSEG